MIKNGDVITSGLLAQNDETGQYIHKNLKSYPPIPGEKLRLVWTNRFEDAKILPNLEEWEKFLGKEFFVFMFVEVQLVARLEIV
jgi:hypothetical protein